MDFSVSEQKQNPDAVIDALKTYEKSIKCKAGNNAKYIGADSMEDITEDDSGSDGSRQSSTIDTTSPEAGGPPAIPVKTKKGGQVNINF